MDIISIIFIAVGLSMDAFAVAITSGIVIKENLVKNSIKISAYFGTFQAIMPLLGWIAGLKLADYVSQFDHWVAFGLLGLIGAKMIYESTNGKEDSEFNPLHNKVLFFLAIATSIDALAVGITFAFLQVPIVHSIILIGLITFAISFSGVLLGRKFGQVLKSKAELIGGLLLIIIGFKIVIEHTNFYL